MNIKDIIDIVLESSGGLNLYAKEVRDKIISDITERICLDEGYDNVFSKEECAKIQETVDERNKRIVAQHNVEKNEEEGINIEKKSTPPKARRVKRKKSKSLSKFTD